VPAGRIAIHDSPQTPGNLTEVLIARKAPLPKPGHILDELVDLPALYAHPRTLAERTPTTRSA
jgi:hypothetical protein